MAFITALLAGTVTAALIRSYLLRKASSEARVAALGTCLVMGFVVIRAASFHHIDALIASDVAGIRWNAINELPGVPMIAICANLVRQHTAAKLVRRPHHRVSQGNR